MSIVKIGDKEFVPYITTEQIDQAVRRVARQIDDHYTTCQEPVVMLVTLAGAMMFAADLNRHLTTPVEWAFVKCSSYGATTNSGGEVIMEIAPTADLAGRDVLVVEDIVDSGSTWVALHNYLQDKNLRSLRIATLAIKREVYNKSLPIDFVALEIENKFVVGYGFDYDQKGRNLNGIYQLASC